MKALKCIRTHRLTHSLTSKWNVTFVGEHLESPPLLRPLWFGAGCDGGCEPFDAPASPPGGPYLTVEGQCTWLEPELQAPWIADILDATAAVRDNGMWEVQASLSPADGQSADRFGRYFIHMIFTRINPKLLLTFVYMQRCGFGWRNTPRRGSSV